ncbi:cell surface protein SprA [Sanyastnella coralliicola]|uniref:T9SS outer membrane translocon Sov/SprA n=1 Tax=Sanyastnella coralliicola TaxID=3069118 RepID=UPI0027BB0DA8|nr:cell surface protein SprA [Longitalea sp. SCSIO 12813]
MRLRAKYLIGSVMLIVLLGLFWGSTAIDMLESWRPDPRAHKPIVIEPDTLDLPFPHGEDPFNPTENTGGISLDWPDNFQYNVEYDPITGTYVVVQTIGDSIVFRSPTSYTLDEYLEYDIQQNVSDYWAERQEEEDEANRAWAPVLKVGGEGFKNIFGSNEIEIRPQGSAELTFGFNTSKTDNPRIPERQRRITTFDFNQRIQLNVVGNIGTKMQLTTQYNTEATFDFENQMKLEYTGDEDEIIKKIEAGNVSMPLSGTLISGSQSLFGVKLETQWGRLRNTTVFSQQQGERKEITVEGGAQTQLFDIRADNYEANKHYFLSQWFRDQYDDACASLPVVNSGVNITRIEVWVVNMQANTQNVRNVIAFSDLGEHPNYVSTNLPVGDLSDRPELAITLDQNPNNLNNDVFLDMTENEEVMGYTGANAAIAEMNMGYQQGVHYERVGNARMLSTSEYTYNSRLGFISLRQALNNAEVLAVSYEYTLNGETYQVGTLSQDGYTAPSALILKMLKSSVTQVKLDNGDPAPMWDLMMKNVYSMGAFGINRDNFRLDVWYNDPSTGVDLNYIPRDPLEGQLLLQLLNLDRLDINNIPNKDGFFDFVDNAATQGGTIESQTGRIFFPVVEPFGEHLEGVIRDQVDDPDLEESLVNTIVYQPLYDSTKTAAQQIPSLNRFRVRGQFQSQSSSEISLNALNVPQGSVSVTAGGVVLVENQDYTVDYNLGRVRILNEGLLESGTPINISLESNSLFNIQMRTLIGSRFDYEVDDNLNIGATVMNLRERPLTQKVNVGDEPVNNTILGADVQYQTESEFLTRLVDRIPLIDTKAKSSIDVSGEAAYLIPGYSRAIGDDGNAYIDDFEGSQSVIDIRSINQWFMASTPKLQSDLFPEGNVEDSLIYNYNRAKLSWYTIDPQFFRGNGLQDGQVSNDIKSDHRMREVLEGEVFPNRELPAGTPPLIPTLDLTFYPDERGQYNYELPNGAPGVSAGLNTDGTLVAPETRWGGIQRALVTTDFETSNVQFIQFWLMDPFHADSENTNGGELYFNLGNVSEDVLNDSQLSYENGLPSANQDLPVLESIWGIYPDPATFNVVNAFDNSTGNYDQQDIGLDGLNSADEQTFFDSWLAEVQGFLDPDAFAEYQADPSADDFEYFRSPEAQSNEWTIIRRYKNFNGYDGNSDTGTPNGYPIAATTIPNTEDINQDITLSTIESYYQYRVSLRPQDLGEENIGSNYITDSFETTVETANGESRNIRWYQFKIPIFNYDNRVGGITDFRSIRFIRMFMKGWSEEATLRFARLELVRGEWREYLGSLEGPQEIEPNDPEPTTFTIGAVNIEENGNREPVPYVIPPGILREIDVGTANQRRLNEQSLSLEVCNLIDGDARAAYRNVSYDMRLYKKLKMFLHAEAGPDGAPLNDNEVTAFIRLGSDFNENYYEYEIPLKVTPAFTGDDDEIWPSENDVEIEFAKFQNLKLSRPAGYPTFQEYIERDGEAMLRVKGNPNLANVIVVMIGIRNPQQDGNPFVSTDLGDPKCVTVWANELRLTDFDEPGGWAAVARMNATLADFGNVSVAANMSTPGWGGIEQAVLERQRETIRGIDANTTLQLGKFFPENLGVQLPVYLGYSETVTTPQFDPLAPDIELDQVDLTPERRKSSQQIVRRRSINFTNVRIDPQPSNKPKKDKKKDKEKDDADDKKDKGGKGGKGGAGKDAKFYDISNVSLSYGYNETYRRDINMEFQMQKSYTGGLNYAFQNKPTEVRPFKNIGSSPFFKWLKDFNFYTGIKSFTFNTTMDRMYETSRVRNNTAALFGVETNVLIQTQVLKTWNWNRTYNLNYDITKALKFTYSANNQALVGEPAGVIDREDVDWYEAYKDTVWNNIQNFGETTNFNHNVSLSYKLPFDKIPMMDWISSDARYQGTYRWDRAPFSQDSLGHTIQNSRNLTLNAQGNLVNLYNKSDFLKEINRKSPKRNQGRQGRNEDKDGFGNDKEDDDDREKVNPLHVALRFLMMVRNVSGSYTRNEGILLPGYAQTTQLVGMDPNFEAPGIPFVLGWQNTDLLGNETGNFALDAAANGWMVNSPFLNQQYSETFSESINLRANLEPIKHFKIELTATRQESRSQNSFFRFDEELGDFEFQSPLETGNFTASIITWATAFEQDDEDFNNPVFDQFLLNRLSVSERLNDETYQFTDPEDNGYYSGWGPTSQDVTIAAFIAAYTGQDVNEVELDPFKTKMAPNWRVTYDGLSKLPAFKKRFKQFNLTHTYRSTISTSYVTNLNYEEDPNTGLPVAVDQSDFGNFIAQRQISSVTISEQLSPLIGFDMTLKTSGKNDPQIRLEMGRDRNMNFALTNLQITETRSNSIVMGVGYRFTEVPNPFYRRRGKLPVQVLEDTQLSLRADLTIRDNVTVIRKVEERQNQPTAGQRILSLKTTADLEVSRKLTLRFFYDHQITRPKISTAFPTSNINSGITLRFQLTQ